MRNFNFDNDTSEIYFTPLYQLYSKWKTTKRETVSFWELTFGKDFSHAKMSLKSAPQKLNFVIAKAISKVYTLDCSCKCLCTFPVSYP